MVFMYFNSSQFFMLYLVVDDQFIIQLDKIMDKILDCFHLINNLFVLIIDEIHFLRNFSIEFPL